MRTERDEETRVIPRLIGWIAGFCARRRWLVLGVTCVSCALAVYANFCYLAFQTQRNDLLGPKKASFQRWQQYVDEFGDDDDMVVVVQGANRARMEEALEHLAAELRKEPEHFDRLFYKVDLRALRNRALLFLPAEQIRTIQDSLKRMELLLEPPLIGQVDALAGWRMLTVDQLLEKAATRLRDGANDKDDEHLFRQTDAICRAAASFLSEPENYRNPWLSIVPPPSAGQAAVGDEDMMAAPQFFFSGDGSLAFLLVRPVKEKENFTCNQKSVDAIKALIKTRVAPAFPDLRLGLTGLPVLEDDEIIASQNDTNLASWLALAGVALLYLIAYRGFRYPMMTVATLLVGTAWALGWTTLTVGHLNILSSAFAVMLIGMGDYGVLWVTRFGQERKAGADLQTAMRTTALSVGSGILTAALTTALAFYATMLADFKAIAELGWIAGSGVLLCALSCFTVMPALLAIFDFRFETDRRRAGAAPTLSLEEARADNTLTDNTLTDNALWLPWVARRPGLVIGVSLAVTAVLGIFAARVRYDHNLLNLQ